MRSFYILWLALATSVAMASSDITRINTLQSSEIKLIGYEGSGLIMPDEGGASTNYKIGRVNDDYEPPSRCTTINENVLYPYAPKAGEIVCVHLKIESNAIVEFIAVDQNDSKQVNLQVIDDPLNNHVFKAVGASNSSSSIDVYKIFAEPGNYYAEFTGLSGDGSEIRVAAVVNHEKADEFEDISPGKDYQGNDNEETAYSVKNGTLKGGVAYLYPPEEYDNYEVLSYWGQDLFVRVSPELSEKSQFVIDLIVNGVTSSIKPNVGYVLKDVEGSISVRVKAKSNGQFIESGKYIFEAGSNPSKILDETPDGDRAARVLPETAGWQRVQNVAKFRWQAKIVDSKDKPIRNTQISFDYTKAEDGEILREFGTTDNDGVVNEAFDLTPPCEGQYSVSYSSGLEIRYNKGQYEQLVRPAGTYTDPILVGKSHRWLRLCDDYESN